MRDRFQLPRHVGSRTLSSEGSCVLTVIFRLGGCAQVAADRQWRRAGCVALHRSADSPPPAPENPQEPLVPQGKMKRDALATVRQKHGSR